MLQQVLLATAVLLPRTAHVGRPVVSARVRPPRLRGGDYADLGKDLDDVTNTIQVINLQTGVAVDSAAGILTNQSPDEQLRVLFNAFDTKRAGKVDAAAIKTALNNGRWSKDADVQKEMQLSYKRAVQLIDERAEPEIDFDEFKNVFEAGVDGADGCSIYWPLWCITGRDPSDFMRGLMRRSGREPSFTRLFTHETWNAYTGRSALVRWVIITTSWRTSRVLRECFPVSFVAALWAYTITSLPGALLPRTSPVPMSLMGTALGLLLVFRTNNSYLRLSEARTAWSCMLYTVRELAQGVATALLWDKKNANSPAARESASRVCRYLACFVWELRAWLIGGGIAASTLVIDSLLDDDEAKWIASQRLRPPQLLGALRRELHDQYSDGLLPPHLHRKLEEDVRELDTIVGSCERLFSSPLPPTMSRHIVRCLQLWLLGFPFVIAGTMAPMTSALWVFAVSYAFVGINEVGVQVEQPFRIIPMNKLCVLAVKNLEEAFVKLPPRMIARQTASS